MHYRIITWCIHVDVYAVIHITLHVFRSLKEPHNLHFITSIHNGIQMCVVERQINDFEPGVQLCYTSAMLSPWTALFKTFCLYHPQRTRAPGWSHCRCHRRRFKSDYMQPPPKPQKILILFITFFFFRSSDPPDPFNCTNVKRSRGNGWREKKSVRAQQSRRITARNNTA